MGSLEIQEDTLSPNSQAIAIEFLLKNVKYQFKNIDRVELKTNLLSLEKSVEKGISTIDLERLARIVVFNDAYDLTTRRKVLNCLIPEDSNFPYEIIPLAISSSMVVPVNPSWQYSVLSWLSGLLEYCAIDSQNIYIHICYTAIFNMTMNLNLVYVACKILGYITRRQDVTAARASILLQLKDKPGFYEKVSYLLRLYQLFRPDLVVGKLSYRQFRHSVPRVLRLGLLALRQRLQETVEVDYMTGGNGIWPDINTAEKVNPHQRSTAIPKPDNTLYAERMEEKTENVIFVSQYRRFSELLEGMEDWQKWKWPNNPSSHLKCPDIIPLFRPNDLTVLISISNWLQIAFRTELVDGIGNLSKERREKILKSLHSVARVTGTRVPIVNQALTDYMVVWDQNSNFELILSLLGYLSYTSPEDTSVTLLKLVTELLDHAPLLRWCKVIAAISNTVGTWAVRAHEERDLLRGVEWPTRNEEFPDTASVGIWFLVSRMDRFFQVGLLEHDYHPMVVHHILDFYTKVRMHMEDLNLPCVFLPSVPIVLGIIIQGDLVALHRLGLLLGSTQECVQRLRNMQARVPEVSLQVECLSMCDSFNLSIRLYLNCIYWENAFGKHARRFLDQFYSFDHLRKMLTLKHAKRCASISRSLPCLMFIAKRISEESEQGEELQKAILEELKEAGFYGIERCVSVYKAH